MPTVALQEAWRAVVAGNNQHRGFQLIDARNRRVEFFDSFHLGVEVAVFARAVGVFEVNKKEIVVGPFAFRARLFVQQAFGLADDVHADQSSEPFVHRVDGNRRGLQPVDFFIRRQDRACRKSHAA